MAAKNAKTKTAKYNVVCRVCSHEHLAEIEKMAIVDGIGVVALEKIIDNNGWHHVGHTTLAKHMNQCVDARRELAIRYYAQNAELLASAGLDNKLKEADEMVIRLAEIQKLDDAIFEALSMLKMSSRAIKEQLVLRVEYDQIDNGKTLTDAEHNKTNKKKSYVPLQKDLVFLYKSTSEELRSLIKTKVDILGIDAESRKANTMESFIDIMLSQAQS